MKTKIATLKDLEGVVDQLNKLLKDPHPGLSTWCAMYSDCMESILEYWNPEIP